jgi:dipeptidyl aminopeptidase/acylaminoacyl peptidase
VKRLLLVVVLVALAAAGVLSAGAATQAPASSAAPGGYSLNQILGFTFASELVAAPKGQRFAWTLFQRGVRSIWVADGPDFIPRTLVAYKDDDGQELTNVAFSADGRFVVYVRGGDHGANWAGEGGLVPNPTSSPIQPKMQIWSVAVDGGAPVLLADGDEPAPNPTDNRIAFVKGREIWVVPVEGGKPAQRMFFARGDSGSPAWSPDGKSLAFVSGRGTFGYIAVYTADDQPIRYMAPTTSLDSFPRWSPDGSRIAFVRRPGRGGAARPPLEQYPSPWAIWVAEVATGSANAVWQSPDTPWGSYPRTEGGANLNWGDGGRVVFLAELDGWPHVYSVPASGGTPLLLTPGAFMVEYVRMTPDRRAVIYNANTGTDKDDIERRHVFTVPVDRAAPTAVTRGKGIEWEPVVSGDGAMVAFIGSDARRPPLPFVQPRTGAAARSLTPQLVAADFPASQLVEPEHVTYTAPDGLLVHAQLFKPPTGTGAPSAAAPAKKPAIVFVHGGPPRQMLLGWHYRYYYANSYAVNQYLASRGFIVLSVNYRLGIGYGHDFQLAERAGTRGASEYQDVLAGGKYLQSRPDVNPSRIGIWGGSYGGFLTAMALGRNSDVFAAGVDLHGVHRRAAMPSVDLQVQAAVSDGITRAHLDEMMKVAWESSPASWVKSWKSPVLLIHGDDDRNVRVDETVDLAQRLRAAGVAFEEMIIPDDVHDFLLYRNWMRADQATAEFFERILKR